MFRRTSVTAGAFVMRALVAGAGTFTFLVFALLAANFVGAERAVVVPAAATFPFPVEVLSVGAYLLLVLLGRLSLQIGPIFAGLLVLFCRGYFNLYCSNNVNKTL